MGWFFGFKLHLIINEKGELLNALLSPGNVDDRKPVRKMTTNLVGLLFGDKGYIDQNLFRELHENGLKLVTGIKKNMQNKLMLLQEKILLRKRSIIETVNGVLKEDFQLSHHVTAPSLMDLFISFQPSSPMSLNLINLPSNFITYSRTGVDRLLLNGLMMTKI